MARKRKHKDLTHSTVTECENVAEQNGSTSHKASDDASHHGMDACESISEAFDPNLALDSNDSVVRKPEEQSGSIAHPHSSSSSLPSFSELDFTDHVNESLSKKRRKGARRSSYEGDSLSGKSKRFSDIGEVKKHCRKYSAPSLSRPSGLAGQNITGIHKKLIFKRTNSHNAESESNTSKTEQAPRALQDQDLILKDMLENASQRTSRKSGLGNSEDKSHTLVHPTILDVKKKAEEKNFVQCEDFDSNIEKDACGDSDEDLPDILGSSQDTRSNIKKTDLVWVKFKKYPHWPAVVRNLHYKKKRVTKVFFAFIGEMYEDDRARTMRVNYKAGSVLPFGGKEHQKLKQKGLETTYSEYFRVAVEKAEDFLMRKATEPELDAFEFFKCDIYSGLDPYLGPYDDDDNSSDKNDISLLESVKEEDESTNNSSSSDIHEEEDDTHDVSVGSFEIPEELRKAQEKRVEKNKRFLEFMRSSNMQDHLCKVKEGKCDSTFHKQFLDNEKKASYNCIFGPIVEDEQQDEVMEILSEIYKKAYKADQKTLLENRNYLLSVWVPEAVLFSLMKVKRIKKERALQILLNGPNFTKAENQLRHCEIISAATDMTTAEILSAEQNYKKLLNKLKRSKKLL